MLTDHFIVNRQPDSGSHPLDITAVHSAQITWDLTDRRFWPRILTLWERPLPWDNPNYEIGVMKYKGRVVIDCDDKPIRNFRSLPLTISSKVEGLRMEAWLRADTRITFPDIAARMWTEWSPKDGKIAPKYRHRALSKRPSNARTRCGLISWLKKRGREAQTEYMDSFRTPAQRMANLGVGRDLNAHEKARYSLLGLNERKESEAPTRQDRIDKIKRVAASGGTLADAAAATATTAGGDDDDTAEDTDIDEAVQEAQTQDQAAEDTDVDEAVEEAQTQDQGAEDDTEDDISASSSLLDPFDSRNDEPMGPGEEALLEDALSDTVEHFLSLTGQEPALTHPGDNYFSQWGMLQEQLRSLWAAGGNAIEVPRLRARDRWTGGISQYHLAELIEGEEDDESDWTQEEDA